MPGFNGIGWFEVGTDDPAAAERFYGDVFGWTVAQDDALSTDPAYQVLAVLVEDVETTCRRVEEAGGRVLRAPEVNPAGVTFAHLLDPADNHFEVFSPPQV
jgi:uncharacterized protein